MDNAALGTQMEETRPDISIKNSNSFMKRVNLNGRPKVRGDEVGGMGSEAIELHECHKKEAFFVCLMRGNWSDQKSLDGTSRNKKKPMMDFELCKLKKFGGQNYIKKKKGREVGPSIEGRESSESKQVDGNRF
ncbi:hypothetical protein U1Q18_032334 [Sarracenia purpurea var. burkii]